MLFAAATIPLGLHRGASLLKDSQERVGGLLEQTSQLRALAEKLEAYRAAQAADILQKDSDLNR